MGQGPFFFTDVMRRRRVRGVTMIFDFGITFNKRSNVTTFIRGTLKNNIWILKAKIGSDFNNIIKLLKRSSSLRHNETTMAAVIKYFINANRIWKASCMAIENAGEHSTINQRVPDKGRVVCRKMRPECLAVQMNASGLKRRALITPPSIT